MTDSVERQLLKQAEAIGQLRREVQLLAEETTETLTNLLVRVESVEDNAAVALDSGAVTSWCWRNIGPTASDALWTELTDWVGWIRHRYPLARKIPDCWAEHPEVVEELTALWLAWQAAYVERDASLTGAAEWHDRWLPGFLHRVERGTFAIDCVSRHQARPAANYAEGASEPRPPGLT